MPITIEKLPDEPILLVTFTQPLELNNDIPELNRQLKSIFDASPEPLWDISIVEDLALPFGDMVSGMAMLTRGEMASLTHPNAAGYAIVTTKQIFQIAANALKQAQYGGLSVTVHRTKEEAFEAVRAKIREKPSALA